MTTADYCATCSAPVTRNPVIWLSRCGTCSVINGQLPPTKYQPADKAEGDAA